MPKKPVAKSAPVSTHPVALAQLADTMPPKASARGYPLEQYHDAIHKLRTRGYTYAEVADFLNQHLAADLGARKIARGQVYRVYQAWLADQKPDEHLQAHVLSTLATDEQVDEQADRADAETKKP